MHLSNNILSTAKRKRLGALKMISQKYHRHSIFNTLKNQNIVLLKLKKKKWKKSKYNGYVFSYRKSLKMTFAHLKRRKLSCGLAACMEALQFSHLITIFFPVFSIKWDNPLEVVQHDDWVPLYFLKNVRFRNIFCNSDKHRFRPTKFDVF